MTKSYKDASHLYEVEHRSTHAERDGFRINELTISTSQNVPWHYHTAIKDTFYVLEGEITVYLREPKESKVISHGDSFVVPAPIYIPLPEGVQPNLDLAATACPWLDDYIAYSKHWGPRAAPLLHEAIGVWLLSVVAADRIQLDVGHSTITTLMIAICAPSSVYAKSTTVTLASRLLCATGVHGPPGTL